MSAIVEKYTLRFGITQGDPAVNGAWASGPLGDQSAYIVGGPGIALAGSTIPQLDVLTRYQNIPRKGSNDGPVTAVEIAGDSPLEAVDMLLGGHGGDSDRYRISLGAPYIGTLDEIDHLKFVPVHPIPMLGVRYDNVFAGVNGIMKLSQFNAESLVWDASMDSITPAGFASPLAAPLIPCRIKIYRGTVPGLGASRERAPYAANVLWKIIDRGDGNPTNPQLIVVTDGRLRVRWTVGQKAGGGASMRVDGIQGYKGLMSTGGVIINGRIDLPSFDPLNNATPLNASDHVPTIFDWNNANPYFAQAVTITGAIGDAGYINCAAYES